MKNLIIFFISIFISFNANAWEDKPKKDTPLNLAYKEADECYKKVKNSKPGVVDKIIHSNATLDEKIDCLFKIMHYLDMRDSKLQQNILDLQLMTTGY